MEKAEKTTDNQVNTDLQAWRYLREINSLTEARPDKTALTDGCRSYSYREMFREWERYAAVFSALGMTGENRARVGLIGSTSAEAVFAMYGLNTVGAEVSLIAVFSVFNIRKMLQTVREEKLTDIILTDDFVQPELYAELVNLKSALGLNHVIWLHVPIGGECVDQMLSYGQEYKYAYLKNALGENSMEALLARYGNHPITYAPSAGSETAFILHTSGTSTGTGKPIPLSDKALNYFGSCYSGIGGIDSLREDAVCTLTIDLSNAYGLVNQLHAPLALNGTVVMVPGAAFNPLYYRAIPAYGVRILFCTSALLEMWLHLPAVTNFDFSGLRGVIIGGTAVSANDKRRYAEFLRRHGAGELLLINGYGLSELGGACILSTPELDDESIGYPLPGVEVCLCDEDTGIYHTGQDAPCSGVLYLRSDAMTCGCLDGKELVKRETVKGREFICSNDLVQMDADGRITYLGRANRFFLNSNGIKYEAGRVETAFSGQEGIESCGVIAAYSKTTHDNIPMLCVKPLVNDETAEEVIRSAFLKIFVKDRSLSPTNMPLRVLIAEELPRNPNGKLDVCRIGKGDLPGKRYSVETEGPPTAPTDVRFVPLKEEADDTIRQAVKHITEDIFANSPYGGRLYSFTQKEVDTMNKNAHAQAFFNNFNQMGSQWMNAMNWANQMAMMNQMNQMMVNYANQMHQMMRETADKMNQQNMEMMQNFNKMLQEAFEKAQAESKEEE